MPQPGALPDLWCRPLMWSAPEPGSADWCRSRWLVARTRKNGAAGPRATTALRRFSRYGAIFVAGIALTGMINTWHMLEGRLDLGRSYDRVLFAKVALFTMMVTVAALNRYRLVPRLTRSDPALVFRALSFTIVIELFIGAVVLLAVSALGLMSPYS